MTRLRFETGPRVTEPQARLLRHLEAMGETAIYNCCDPKRRFRWALQSQTATGPYFQASSVFSLQMKGLLKPDPNAKRFENDFPRPRVLTKMGALWLKKHPKPLIPPDLARCQAEKPGNGPFILGGQIGNPRNGYRVRCENPPTCIATEREVGPDGRRGSMSLCAECRTVFVQQCGAAFATFSNL